MNRMLAVLTIGAAVLAAGAASAQDRERLALGAQASTLGFGAELAFSVSPMITLRGVGNYLSFDYSNTYSGIDYDLDVDLMSGGGFLDFHPLRNGFHVTVGALYNGNEAGLDSTVAAGSTIGGFVLPVGTTLSGDLEFDEFAPYLGVGYADTFTRNSNWSFVVRAGVLYQGDPSVSFTESSGSVPQADLDAEARTLEDDLSFLEFYPVVSVGLSYRF
ncbi:MAG: hypothetical protein V3R98_04440 [Alphaproteobacteria bacterium]